MNTSPAARTRVIPIVALAVIVVAAACTAGDPRFTADAPAGFWVGLWHGAISMITLVIGIFVDHVHVYEVHNTGGWYDFGFLIGATSLWGASSHRAGRRRRRDAEWDEIGRKVEAKLAVMLRRWAEAEPDEDWHEVERKASRKLKTCVRRWAEEPIDTPDPIAPPRA